ncbi:putative transferase CAF17 homolog, mitochondrial [Anthonomus grandis grandis]|uniref:putative transferase CAF17 homolog, mitochondrial n=1 Tax=Anthonomus grandis grandis TaxID=2921223 RepID=UPI0021667699|nr:putative transferase CAF17 homolog, mitochondrial [Anthonomus grandis grandis]
MYYSQINRFFSSSALSLNALQHLKERSLIQAKGPDVSEFLQGLITNDIHHISEGVGSMFAMFLNNKGRVLYDTIIYKTEEKDSYMLECDSGASSALARHLSMFKVKRKVDISTMDSYKVFVLYNGDIVGQKKVKDFSVLKEYDKDLMPVNSLEFKMVDDMYVFKDPRVLQLGFRVLSPKGSLTETLLNQSIPCSISNNYKKLRYSLGIGEGTEDLPMGNAFPLECNCDYLHGVSFHKGCYIGQELTARTYHTGVIRKRLMPLFFAKIPSNLPEENNIFLDQKRLGKLRGIDGDVGLGLLRVSQALEQKNIPIGDGEATVVKPDWWPIELPKEKLNVQHTTL